MGYSEKSQGLNMQSRMYIDKQVKMNEKTKKKIISAVEYCQISSKFNRLLNENEPNNKGQQKLFHIKRGFEK